jgi:hypothetical protein
MIVGSAVTEPSVLRTCFVSASPACYMKPRSCCWQERACTNSGGFLLQGVVIIEAVKHEQHARVQFQGWWTWDPKQFMLPVPARGFDFAYLCALSFVRRGLGVGSNSF